MRMDDVEIGAPLPTLPSVGPQGGTAFAGSICLVRLHGKPLGKVELDLPPEGLSPDRLAERVQEALGDQIAAHLRDDGLEPGPLGPEGLDGAGTPRCESERLRFLEQPPFASVVICTRDRPDSVRTTLDSILSCRYPRERFEIIVVDNASHNDSVVRLVETEYHDDEVAVSVVEEPVPGLSNARNRGLTQARGEIVVFADDDVLVDRDWLAILVGAFERSDRVGATSGLTLPDVLETPAQRWVEGFGGRDTGFGLRVFDLENPPPDGPLFPFTVGEFGAGRNMAFRRDLLRELGGFDPALGPGTIAHDGDDIEALLRVLLSGRQIVHDPGAIVWHAHPADYGELEERVFGYGAGLTACLTRAMMDHPRLLIDLLRKLPSGLRFAISPRSQKNVGRQQDFPRALARRELLGLAYGPVAYLRSRRQARRLRRSLPPPDGGAAAGPGRRKLRVLIVSDEYQPVIGGAARSVETLAHSLARQGHTVEVATAWQPDTPGREVRDGIPVHRIRDLTSRAGWLSEDPERHHAPPFPDPEAAIRLRALVRRFRPDVVHAYGWLAHSAAAALVGKRVPLVLSLHDYGNACSIFTLVRHGRACSGPAPLKCLDCAGSVYGYPKAAVAVGSVFGVRPLLRRRVDAIHSVNRLAAELIERALDEPDLPVEVIPNFLDDEAREQPDEAILAQLPDRPFILYVGHLRGYKGINELLAAYRRLQNPPPLVLVGTRGPDTPAKFPPGVTTLTYVPHATVMELWRRALFAVSPSLAPETGPLVAQEAMSVGRAVIGTRIGGYEDLIDDGETGLLVPPGDAEALAEAMRSLIEDGELRERIGEQAAQRALAFTPEAAVPEMERLYTRVLGDRVETASA